MEVKLAELLLRRKELQEKVEIIKHMKGQDIYEIRTERRSAHEGIDDIIAQVPKLELKEVTKEYDWHARQLREVDAAIQNANWTTAVEVKESNMADYA